MSCPIDQRSYKALLAHGRDDDVVCSSRVWSYDFAKTILTEVCDGPNNTGSGKTEPGVYLLEDSERFQQWQIFGLGSRAVWTIFSSRLGFVEFVAQSHALLMIRHRKIKAGHAYGLCRAPVVSRIGSLGPWVGSD